MVPNLYLGNGRQNHFGVGVVLDMHAKGEFLDAELERPEI